MGRKFQCARLLAAAETEDENEDDNQERLSKKLEQLHETCSR
jgi:hypothetical protein